MAARVLFTLPQVWEWGMSVSGYQMKQTELCTDSRRVWVTGALGAYEVLLLLRGLQTVHTRPAEQLLTRNYEFFSSGGH